MQGRVVQLVSDDKRVEMSALVHEPPIFCQISPRWYLLVDAKVKVSVHVRYLFMGYTRGLLGGVPPMSLRRSAWLSL